MPESAISLMIVGLSFLALLGVVTLMVIVQRRLPRYQTTAETHDTVVPAPDTPINRLSFSESFDVEQFAMASEQSALSHLNQLLQAPVGDGIVVAVNGIRLLPSSTEMIVSISQNGQKLLDQGKAVISRHLESGRALPTLRDARTGQFIESFKEAKVATAVSRLGTLSAVIVGAAHIISGADIARRLKDVEAKIDLLIAYRRIDQMAVLERIYTAAKELLAGPLGSEERWEIWRLRNELRELRLAWRREFQYHLNLIDDPQNAGWLKRMFTSQRSTDKSLQNKITDAQINVTLVEYSMRLDHVLAAVGGTLEKFEATLADELADLEGVAKLLNTKAGLISGKFDDLTVEPTVKAMTAIIKRYRELLPDRVPPDIAPTGLLTTK